MMPLVMADAGEENIIRRVGGSPEMKKHLEDMPFAHPPRFADSLFFFGKNEIGEEIIPDFGIRNLHRKTAPFVVW